MLVNQILRRSQSWQEFNDHLQTLGEKEKGDCFEALTRYYLQIHPTYSTKLRNVWLLRDVPHKIKGLLNLPSADEGIDLIAETKDNKYWAIQCKYRADETKSLTHGDLATFATLSFNICRNIEFALVCTTADRFSYKLKHYGERLSLCCGDVWRSLDQQFFQRLHAYLDGRTVLPVPSHPRPHQERAISNAYEHFIAQGNSRGKLIMPCGTGKSLTAYWIARKLAAKNIIVAVPSLALIRQTLELWATESQAEGWEVNWICVCSDPSVTKFEKDDPIAFTQDLGIRVHTDPEEITSWLEMPSESANLVLTTYQSGKAIAEASRKANFVFDLGILDEAHKTVGKKDASFSHLLDDKNITIEQRVFMTATERRYKGSSDEILSMENPEVYGDTFELLTFKNAVESRPPILSGYKIITIGVTKSEIAHLIQDNVLVKPDGPAWEITVEAETLATVVALRKAMQRFPIRHAVSFHSSIARAKIFKKINDEFCALFPHYGNLETFHVSGKTPTSVRANVLDDFASSDQALMTNARCLTEGIDVPDIDCVLFADPRKSAVDIVQATGRALRLSDGKAYGYVLVPVLVEDGSGPDDFLESAAFSDVMTILRGLATNDERIIDYFRDVSRGVDRKKRNNIFVFDVPVASKIDLNKFAEAIEPMFWARLAKLFWRPFEKARSFVHELSLHSKTEWFTYCEGGFPEKGARPEDIPANPNTVYKDKGWKGWGDWLGTGTIATFNRIYRPYEKARKFVNRLELRNQNEWFQYCRGKFPHKGKLPEDIPADPWGAYKNKGWNGYGDWLGTGTIANQDRIWRTYEEAHTFVHGLELASRTEWAKYCKGEFPDKVPLPEDIPTSPSTVYKNKGWKGWGDWLGTGTLANQDKDFRPFEEARKFVHQLRLPSQTEWWKYCKGEFPDKAPRPDDIPADPAGTYKDKGWKGWGDWLGTGTVANQFKMYRPFKEAREFVHRLNLKSIAEWKSYCAGKFADKEALPDDIPSNPNATYKRDWKGWGDWLGTGTIAKQNRKYRSYEDARRFVHGLGLKSSTEWKRYVKGGFPEKKSLPVDIPMVPDHYYKGKGWVDWVDWLGVQAKEEGIKGEF